jgi:flagellar basal body-associated protein FliL
MDQALGMQQNGMNSSVLDYMKKPFEVKANTRDVLLFWLFVIVAVTVFKFTWNFKYNYLHQDLFLRSFSEIGGPIQEFNPNVREESEPFYDNSRFSKNLLTLPRLNVNLKRSVNSGDNPMGAFELTVEGLSSDAIIEIKDREAEFRDLIARFVEEKNYDELTTAQGKSDLCDKLRDKINENLTVGQVRRVLIKNFLMKP